MHTYRGTSLLLRKGPILIEDAHSVQLSKKSTIFRVTADCIYNLWWHAGLFKLVANQNKKFFKNGQIYKLLTKINFRFFELWSILYRYLKWIEKLPIFEYKIDHISKIKNQKINFSFVSAHSAFFMYIWQLLRRKKFVTILL